MARESLAVVAACAAAFAFASCGKTGANEAASGHEQAVTGRVPEMSFVRIPPGSFDMGFDATTSPDQNPVHHVTISRPFELERTEVTQAQWRAVMGNDPAHFQGDDRPVESVSWDDAQEFIRRLNKLDPGRGYRLPTEAEWEYACRAGSTERGVGDLDENAWWHHNSEDQTHDTGLKRQNPWGLYDMIGNVWEYCSDWKDSYPAGSVTDPTGPEHGYYKISRGGSWFDVGRAANATFRASPAPSDRGNSQGFRLARTAAH